MFTIQYADKRTAQVKIGKFAALDGWNIQQNFLRFAASNDAMIRREYTMEVLSYATVIVGENEVPLTTDALIDNHLQSWENVRAVFEEVLTVNGIDPKTHANQTKFWQEAGQEMATAFIAEAIKLLGPGMNLLSKDFNKAE